LRRLIAALAAVAALGTGALATSALAAPAGTTHLPDLQTIIPPNSFSIVQSASGREFRYTHLVYNNGPGPLEIQPQYSQASGTYQGMQQLFTHNASGAWSLVSQVRVPDAFDFHAPHGHFHFPLAAFGLYQVAPGGGIGAPVSLSPKNGFCITDSYIYNTSVEHSGAFVGQRGSCADPTSLRGLSVGGADEYDYRDPGQAIPFDGIPDGTYWFRAMTDPNNDLVEANESNNGTDVLVTVSGSQVTASTTTNPDTTPPAVSMTAPADGASVSGAVGLTATSPITGANRVAFVVDGVPVGTSSDTAAPYHLTWDSTTVPDGQHWVAARATDAQGRINTSTVAALNVSNAEPPPPPPPPGSFAIDASASTDGRGTLASSVQVPHGGDLLLAFVSSDGPKSGQQTAIVSGGGLSWSLVRRANARLGASEVWKATGPAAAGPLTVTSTPTVAGYDQSLTVIAFAGAGGVGASSAASAASGGPSASVTTTRDGSWVFGVGNDWDRAVARTVGSGQVMRHEWIDTQAGDSFWLQSRVSPTAASGTVVSIDDVAPTTDQWNLVAVEVLPGSSSPPPDTAPPQVSVSDPEAGETVSGIVAIGAVAADNVGVTSVRFKIDGEPLGAPITAPPFMAQWDTRTYAPGQHTITAEASDAAGNVGTSPGVAVTVDNSAPPPATIAIDALQFQHATGTLTSPPISTTADDVLVAYVGLGGPNAAGGQTATVEGAGLTWSLVKRSNTQAGDAEIWSAKATGPLTNAVVTATPEKTGYPGSLTVIAYKGAAGVGVAGAAGAPSGEPDIYLPGIGMGSWVFAVGNDWDRAVARTPVAGQVLQDEWLAAGVEDSFWVQSTAAPNAAPGLVTIHDSSPANDRWNYAAVEILPAASGPQPSAPNLTATIPASPANQNSPKLFGSAPAGTTVRLYSGADCSGPVLASGSAAELEAGIEVSVPDDSTTPFRATATAESTSPCSAALTYVEDSSAPQTEIDAHPAALSASASASFQFSGEDPGGSGLASFQCRRDSTKAVDWATCASPQQYGSLPDGSHRFEARAIDLAGNADSSPASFEWQIDTTPPTVVIDSGPSGPTEDPTPSFEFHSTEIGTSFACSIDTGTPGFGPCSGPGASHTPLSPLANGTYTFRVRATDAAGNQATASRGFTVATTVPSLALDKIVTTHQGSAASTISAPALTTSQPNELLLAFIGSDGPRSGSQSISGVSGGGLTWTLRQRANVQRGTAEIWQAVAPLVISKAVITATRSKGSYQGAISVAAFIGADTTLNGATGSGAGASGAPSASLIATRAGGWVWAAGSDWDNAIGRTVGPGQTLVDQYLSPSGDTFWVQRQTTPTLSSGTTVVMNDTAPTTDQWNLALVEVAPAPNAP
jgi:Big-like domain-containing protein/lysyl oxidase